MISNIDRQIMNLRIYKKKIYKRKNGNLLDDKKANRLTIINSPTTHTGLRHRHRNDHRPSQPWETILLTFILPSFRYSPCASFFSVLFVRPSAYILEPRLLAGLPACLESSETLSLCRALFYLPGHLQLKQPHTATAVPVNPRHHHHRQ